MAKGKTASHARSTRTVSTKGAGVGGRKVIHQAPASFGMNGASPASGKRPGFVTKAMKAGTKNSPGSIC